MTTEPTPVQPADVRWDPALQALAHDAQPASKAAPAAKPSATAGSRTALDAWLAALSSAHPENRLEAMGKLIPYLTAERKALVLKLRNPPHNMPLRDVSILAGVSIGTIANIEKGKL